jgi:long-chain acyl-CoA synthetase
VESLFGMVLHNGYGVTECSPNISQAVVGERRTDTSVGKILPGVEVQLVGSDQKPVPTEKSANCGCAVPNVMKGYYRAPEETAAAINPEGWFNTRDLASSGKRISLYCWPNQGTDHSLRRECLSRGGRSGAERTSRGRALRGDWPDGRGHPGGEEVVAFVQLAPSSPTSEADLAQHAAQHLAPYKRPSQILFVPSMPLTPTGKVIKGELAKMTHSPNAR